MIKVTTTRGLAPRWPEPCAAASRIRGLVPALCLAALVLTGCGAQRGAASAPGATTAAAAPGAAATPAAVPPASATPGYPSSIAVLGHSNATGEDSDPAQPHAVITANSWATGTNPAVNSIYRRILAKTPRSGPTTTISPSLAPPSTLCSCRRSGP